MNKGVYGISTKNGSAVSSSLPTKKMFAKIKFIYSEHV